MDKYPARYTFLPHNFGAKPTDNGRLLEHGISLFDGVLRPSPSSLGVNKRAKQVSTAMQFGEIYVLWAIGTTLFKIGVTSDFNRRFRDITSASPVPITVIKYARCDNPHLLERHLHSAFAAKLFKNEWFSLEQADIDEIQKVFDRYFERHHAKAA